MDRCRRLKLVALLLCAATLLSGVLLTLHGNHCGEGEICPACAAILQQREMLLCAAALTVGWLLAALFAHEAAAPMEDRFDPVRTLVQRKVMLLD